MKLLIEHIVECRSCGQWGAGSSGSLWRQIPVRGAPRLECRRCGSRNVGVRGERR